ncbi:MAG: hypothetical protein WC164_01200 [Patescibacteria group bacterium]|nr:hypothetical protein [Patescibacteria group bacterium]
MEKKTIFTHCNIDIDAMCSIWFTLRFVLKKNLEEVNVVFKPANWDGEGMSENDLALDIYAGGKGIKGEFKDNRTYSCFKTLFRKNHEKIDSDFKKIIYALSEFIDKHDSQGQNFLRSLKINGSERSEALTFKGLFQVFWGYKINNDDLVVVQKFSENLNNFIDLEIRKKKIFENLENVDSDKVILTKNVEIPSGLLSAQGKKIKVYVDGFNVGVVIIDPNLRNEETFAVIRKVVERSGEFFGYGDNWFIDPGYRLICRGSRNNIVKTPSKVDPQFLFERLKSFVEKKELETYLTKNS